VFALLLVAVALGLSNFAASLGMGIGGVDGGLRMRVALVFGLFEAGMPVLGVAIGDGVTESLGHAARWLGGAILILVGCYTAVRAWLPPGASGQQADPDLRLGRVLVSGFALSMDNLAAGFALGAYHVSLGVAAVLFGVISVGMSLAGLELGARLGAAFGSRGELAAGAVLIVIGVLMAGGVLLPGACARHERRPTSLTSRDRDACAAPRSGARPGPGRNRKFPGPARRTGCHGRNAGKV
jgi:manganese efflux pump family protein